MNEQENLDKLLNECKSGNRVSFDILIRLYEKKVYRLCYRFFNNEDDALDATQEVFIKVYNYISKFEGRSNFNTWLYKICSNTCITISDKKKREKAGLLGMITDWFQSFTEKNPEEITINSIEQIHNKQIVSDCLSKIPEKYRMPIILKDIEGLSLESISESLDVPVGTVKSRLNRGRTILQEKILTTKGSN